MNVLRVAITGTVGAGKSTLVQTVGEIGSVSTEELATDEIAERKPTTTVALDFSRVNLDADTVLHVYGTPGQSRFDFMWDILMQKAHVCLVLVAAHRQEDFEATREILRFIQQRSQARMAIGITHTDCDGAMSTEMILTALTLFDDIEKPSVVTLNPQDRTSVLQALATVVKVLAVQA